MLRINLLPVATASLLILAPSFTVADERYNPVKNEIVIEECGACHMTFQPQMLPKRSWKKIMNELPDHFGEDASLDDSSINQILKYLQDNAADAGLWSGKFMRGIKNDMVPLRITKMPYWIREHNEEVPAQAWNDPKVKSRANCIACHAGANSGNYDDD